MKLSLKHPGFKIEYLLDQTYEAKVSSKLKSVETVTMSRLEAYITDIVDRYIYLDYPLEATANDPEVVLKYRIRISDLEKFYEESKVLEESKHIEINAALKSIEDQLFSKTTNKLLILPYNLTQQERSILLAFLSKARQLKLERNSYSNLSETYLNEFIYSPRPEFIIFMKNLGKYLEKLIFNFTTVNMETENEKKLLSPIDQYRSDSFYKLINQLSQELSSGSFFEVGMTLSSLEFFVERARTENNDLWKELAPKYFTMLDEAIEYIYANVKPDDVSAKVLLDRLYKLLGKKRKTHEVRTISVEQVVVNPKEMEIDMNPIDLSEINFEGAEVNLSDILNAVRLMRKRNREILPDPENPQGVIINYQESFDYNELFNQTNKELINRDNNPKAIMFLLRLHIRSRELFRAVFEYVAYQELAANNANEVIIPALISEVTNEPIVAKGAKNVVITYTKKIPAEGSETAEIILNPDREANFDWIFDQLEERVVEIINTVDLLERPIGKTDRGAWELENILNPLNELMMIFNTRISQMLPSKSSETGRGKFIAEDWDIMKPYVGLKDKQSFTDYLFASISRQYIPRVLGIIKLALDMLDKDEIEHDVTVGYQGVGKGAFGKTNKKVIETITELQILELDSQSQEAIDFKQFIRNLFTTNIGETGTGTGRISVPEDGDPKFAFAAPIARGTLSELVKGGGMVNDDFMTLMVQFEMLKMILLGYDGADIDTFPRTPGQLKAMNELIIPYFEQRGIKYKTNYQIYEMCDATMAEIIMNNRDAAAKASQVLAGELSKLSNEKAYMATFPNSPLVASVTVGKESTKDLTNDDMEGLKVFYRDRAMEIRDYLLSGEKLLAISPSDIPNRDIVLNVYRTHVMGFTKIIGQRVAGRLIAEKRSDDNIIYSLLNRIRSTEGTYGSFVTGVAESIIPVDGKPEEAWEMWFRAKLQNTNPDLLRKIDEADSANTELRALWLEILQIGKAQHEETINPKPVEA